MIDEREDHRDEPEEQDPRLVDVPDPPDGPEPLGDRAGLGGEGEDLGIARSGLAPVEAQGDEHHDEQQQVGEAGIGRGS